MNLFFYFFKLINYAMYPIQSLMFSIHWPQIDFLSLRFLHYSTQNLQFFSAISIWYCKIEMIFVIYLNAKHILLERITLLSILIRNLTYQWNKRIELLDYIGSWFCFVVFEKSKLFNENFDCLILMRFDLYVYVRLAYTPTISLLSFTLV